MSRSGYSDDCDDRADLIAALRGGRQCDEEGVEIIMSRQACVEAANLIEGAATHKDVNSYCLILRELGMEEEGDPVAEVMRLKRLVEQQGEQEPFISEAGVRKLMLSEYHRGCLQTLCDLRAEVEGFPDRWDTAPDCMKIEDVLALIDKMGGKV